MHEKQIRKYKADKIVFFICLIVSLGLFVGGFFVPPMGEIDGSILKAVGELLGFATLAVAAQAVKDGRLAKFTKGDIEVTIGNDEDKE